MSLGRGLVDGGRTVDARNLYLDLLKQALLGRLQHTRHELIPIEQPRGWLARVANWAAGRAGGQLAHPVNPDDGAVEQGDFTRVPTQCDTMVGRRRLDNVQWCVERVIADGIAGDLIETGVWRGGVTILMRAVLAAYGANERRVWVADSFRGLPAPRPAVYPADEGSSLHTNSDLAVSVATVRANFERYGLLDDSVVFLQGWFNETLPGLRDQTWALIRLDGDMYGSTIDALRHLYPRLSNGGYVIVDDYGAYESCRRAVHDFRAEHGIVDRIETIDWTGVYRRRGWA